MQAPIAHEYHDGCCSYSSDRRANRATRGISSRVKYCVANLQIHHVCMYV